MKSKNELKEIYEFKSFNSIPNIFFKTIGMKPYLKDPSDHDHNRKITVLFYIGFINLFLLYVGEIIMIVKVFGNFQNFVEITDIAMCVGFISIAFVKVATIFSNIKRMSKLINYLELEFPKTIDDQHKFNVKKYVLKTKRIMKSYAILFMTMIWCYNLFALAESIIGYARFGNWNADFPYVIWYPFDPYVNILFEFNYLSQVWAGYVAAAATLSSDLLLCGAVIQVCMHYDNLRQDLLHLKPTPTKEHHKHDYFILIKYIQRHNKIIRLISEIDDMFGISILFNFISSAVIICLLGFLATTAVKITSLFKYAFTLIACAVQVFVVCWLGENVIDSSKAISTAAYNSYWFDSNNNYKKGLILIMLRSQRPQVLTAYKFSVASLPRFSSVMSTSWSFFALLHSVYTK